VYNSKFRTWQKIDEKLSLVILGAKINNNKVTKYYLTQKGSKNIKVTNSELA